MARNNVSQVLVYYEYLYVFRTGEAQKVCLLFLSQMPVVAVAFSKSETRYKIQMPDARCFMTVRGIPSALSFVTHSFMVRNDACQSKL